MRLLTLTHRLQGLVVAEGNPKGIHTLDDLTRSNVEFVNRQVGSGTRIWLDNQLLSAGIPKDKIKGYGQVTNTHLELCQVIAQNAADAGIGLMAAAHRYGLDFIPLFQERFDLVLPAATASESQLQPILNHLQSSAFRQSVRNLGGYDTQQTGDVRGV
jgi:putative molybdopterin biosynthesis protein